MPKPLAPVRPNVGLELAYQKKLDALIEDMHRSLIYWLRAAYRANEPELAQDAPDAGGFESQIRQMSPARALQAAMRRLARRWQLKFNTAADELARYFAESATQRSDAALRSILRRNGLTVRFRMTRAANDVLQATIGQNVSLIRSIGQQHLGAVEGIVMRSVQAGRDLGYLSKELEHQFGVTKRRAAFIARSQNNLATAAIQRVRQTELGIAEAVWMHSGGGRTQRASHVKAGRDKVRYDVKTGWFDPHEQRHIWPGELPNCRCVARAVLPVLSGVG